MASLVARHSRVCEGYRGRAHAISLDIEEELDGCTCPSVAYLIRYWHNDRCRYERAGSDRAKAIARCKTIETKLTGGWKPRSPRRRKPRDLYFALSILSGSLIKIGVTSDIDRRMRDLLAEPLHVIEGGERLERKMHDRFGHLCFLGEWFHFEGELVEYLRSVGAII